MPPDAPAKATPVARDEALLGVFAPSLYADHVKVYPRAVRGPFRQVKWAILTLCLAFYYLLPWLRWDRGPNAPNQALLVDMAGPRAYLFNLEIWPQEVYYITGLLILGAIALFLATALYGRVWCGYTCPQTVWTDLFMAVERWTEGDRNARIKRDAQPMSADKLLRKTAKHTLWLVVSAATGGAWIMYFQDAPTVTREIVTGGASMATYFFFGLFTLTTYVLAGWAREQVCTYMCPWPRFQAAMQDEHSLVVTYQGWRGETRGKHKAGETWEGRGDCIDCNQCVVVCPMGIDIRDGAQLECINCGLCIDACNEVMDKVGRPRGLIAYDTDAAVAARSCGQKPQHRLIRARTLYHGVALTVVGGLMIWGFNTRRTVDVHALRDRNPAWVRLHDGAVRNGYTLKIANHGFEPATVEIRYTGVPGATVRSPGLTSTGPLSVQVEPNRVTPVRVFVTAAADEAGDGRRPATFEIRSGDEVQSVPTAFDYGETR